MTGAPITDRVTSRLTEFGLVTAHELVPRSAQTSLVDTLPIVLELLDLEAVERRQRRIERFRHDAGLPPGNVHQLHTLATGRISRPPPMYSRSDCPVSGRATRCAA